MLDFNAFAQQYHPFDGQKVHKSSLDQRLDGSLASESLELSKINSSKHAQRAYARPVTTKYINSLTLDSLSKLTFDQRVTIILQNEILPTEIFLVQFKHLFSDYIYSIPLVKVIWNEINEDTI